MFTNVRKRPSVRVNHRGCESNLPEESTGLVNIGTFNARTLYDNESKLELLLKEMKRLDICILGVSETHWSVEMPESFETDGYVIVHSGRGDGIHRQGVAFIIHKSITEHLQRYDLISQRLMMIQIETKTTPLFIFQVYAPDSTYPVEEAEAFYELLQSHINSLPRKSKIIILGDFNAKPGSQSHKTWPNTVGHFCVGNKNDNGDRLLQFCAINEFSLINTLYKQPKHRLVSWTSPDGKTQSQLDFLITPSNQKCQVKKCRVYNSFDIDSDHSLVMMKYRMCHRRPKTFAKAPKRFAVERFQDDEIRESFMIKIGGAFNLLLGKSNEISVEEMYNDFTKVVNEFTEETVGKRLRKPVEGLDEETIRLCKERRQARTSMLTNPTNEEVRKRYKSLNKAVKKAVIKAKTDAMERKTRQIENDFKENKTHELFKNVKELEGKPRKPLMAVKDATGNKTTNTSEILSIWQRHYERHLNKAFPREEEVLDSINIPVTNNDDFMIEKNDIRKAIKMMKTRKAPGHDGIAAETLKAGGEPIVDVLHTLFNAVLTKNEVPTEWSKMLVTPIHKKGDTSNPENYRAISLLSIPGKVFNRIVLNKIREKTEVFTSNTQFGFRPKKGTVDAIFIVRQIMEKAKERRVNLHFNFIDFKSAFDTVWREALWKMLLAIEVPSNVVNTIKKMYENTKCSIIINGRLTDWFKVTIGVRQGCLLSPTLFNLFLDFLMKELACLQETLTFDSELCCDIRYADDTTLIAATFELLELSTTQLEAACAKYGLKINGDKCKLISPENEKQISIDGKLVAKVEQFTFLGSTIPGTTPDIDRRLALAYTAFGKLNKNVWSNKNLPMRLKTRLLHTLIFPIATYACSTWTLTKKDANKLRVLENNCLRGLLGARLQDRISIKTLHEKAGTNPFILNFVKKQRLTWYGHVVRMEDNNIVKQVMNNDFTEKRKRGCPPKRWKDQIKEDTEFDFLVLNGIAVDRAEWRSMVNNVWAKSRP